MDSEANKAGVQRFLKGFPERPVVDELVTLDAIDHGISPGWPPTSEGFEHGPVLDRGS